MTIKELCNKSDCASCVFFSECIRTDKNPKAWDDYTNKIITKTVIETAKMLLEDETTKDKLNLMYGNGNNVYVDTDSIKAREDLK